MTDELASGPHDSDPAPNLWWALHRPETYALSSLVIAVAVLFVTEPVNDLVQLIFFDSGSGFGKVYGTMAAIRLGMALLAIGLAASSIRSEDEDATWSPPVARAALIIATLGGLIEIATLFAWLASTPHVSGFTSPSP